MEDGEQLQMICINLALVTGNWWEWIHIERLGNGHGQVVAQVSSPAGCSGVSPPGTAALRVRPHEMEAGEQFQMIGINLALIARQGRLGIHTG
jgi:hypothetical protein